MNSLSAIMLGGGIEKRWLTGCLAYALRNRFPPKLLQSLVFLEKFLITLSKNGGCFVVVILPQSVGVGILFLNRNLNMSIHNLDVRRDVSQYAKFGKKHE